MHTKGFTLINRGTIKGNHSGFTLIELLVVISIIAVLSTIGVSNFFGAAKNARDAQRKNDINALADAYEVHFDAPSSQYFPLQNDWFGSGRIPTPPEGGNYLGLLALPSTTGFEVCATLENNSTFCKRSRQITYIPTASPSPGASPSGPSPSPSPTSTTVVQDSFNRANSATSLGTSDTGQAWTAAKGTFGITGNQAYISSGCPAPAYAVVDAGITDAIIQVTLPANIQDARIPFRYVDLNNMYWLETAGGSYQLNKFLNGVRSVPASSGITPANGDIIKITVSGTSINVAINGTTRITYNDTSSPINGTKYGIGTWCTTTMRFDDFSVSTVPVVPSPSPIAPLATNTSYDMKVLVLKYFPLTANGQNIDLTYTGDVGDHIQQSGKEQLISPIT